MTEIQYLKGVGPGRAGLLARLGLRSVEDLLFHFPRRWEDRRADGLREEKEGLEPAGVAFGTVKSVRDMYTSGRLRIFRAVIDNGSYEVEAEFFKRHTPRFDVFSALRRDLVPGARVWVVGRPEDPLFKTRLRAEEYYLDSDEAAKRLHVGRIVPVYPLTEGLSQKLMRELSGRALAQGAASVPEPLPGGLLARRALLPRPQALGKMHFPASWFELNAARRRFIYEELFLMALAWAIKRRQTRVVEKGFGYEIKRTLLTPFRENLGFDFTPSQKKAINDIFADMRGPHPMARMLQGDVGSGKTVVALSALLLAVENGGQGAFLAPTEILAEQHYLTFEKFLKGLPVRFALLTSRAKAAERREILGKAAAGELDILIGTHAIIGGAVAFRNLRLTVVDEQHRFGVRQRAALRAKGEKADTLIMTATPIPRTLFLALYGDLDLSTLTELPPGRRPVVTEAVTEEAAFREARVQASQGRQVFVVYPVIEEDGSRGLKSVKAEFERLRGLFGGYRVGALHGAMPGPAKKAAMEDFASGKTDILVATQVVEVGIDVPNASLMIINNAESFGLASLHQLRGRVGRGRHPPRCLLVPRGATPGSEERIKVMCSSSSGFEISEKDIYLRGAGEVMGLAQHGDMGLRVADLARDGETLRAALEDRDALLAADPSLSAAENGPLRHRLLQLYQDRWDLIDLS